MIVTKEQQEALLTEYIKKGNNIDQCDGFIDGINMTLELVDKILKNQNQQS